MFQNLPITTRQIKATEGRLQSIYDAAKLGLRGDNLALAAGMLPTEFRRLCEMDPMAALAEQKGRADAEASLSKVMMDAALSGDAKAALEVLKHKHDWVAKQQVQIDVTQQISVMAALEKADQRIIDVGELNGSDQYVAFSDDGGVRRLPNAKPRSAVRSGGQPDYVDGSTRV
jgi:hypothetical protein